MNNITRPYMVRSANELLALFHYEEEAREEYDKRVKEHPEHNHALMKMNFVTIGGVKHPLHRIIVSHVAEAMEKHSRKHHVMQKIDPKTNEVLETYKSAAEAAYANDIREGAYVIKAARNGGRCGGYKWRIINDNNNG